MDSKGSPLKNLLNKPFSVGSPPYNAFPSKVRLPMFQTDSLGLHDKPLYEHNCSFLIITATLEQDAEPIATANCTHSTSIPSTKCFRLDDTTTTTVSHGAPITNAGYGARRRSRFHKNPKLCGNR